MRHEELREATRKAAEAEPKLHTRLAKGEKPNRKRMAQVAVVYSIARWQRTSGDVLHGLRDPATSRVADQRRLRRLLAVHLERENERTHQSRYADGAVANLPPTKRPTLRLVK